MMIKRKIFWIWLLGVVLVGGLIYIYLQSPLWQYILNPQIKKGGMESEAATLRGKILDIALTARVILTEEEDGGEVNLVLNPEAKLFDEQGKPVDLNYFDKGFEIEAQGVVEDDKFNASEIKIVKAPNIIVFSPQPNEVVGEIIDVRGRTRVLNDQLNIRVLASGNKLYATNITVNAPDRGGFTRPVGGFDDFEKRISLNPSLLPGISDITLEVFTYSAMDGVEADKVSIPLKFESGDMANLKIYFSNIKLDPEVSCVKVFAATRKVPRTPGVGSAALEELLKGPSDAEKADGYFTNINEGVGINSLMIENGLARVDFNEMLQYQVGGSCRVAAIRAQITKTLKQFPGVREVQISVSGKTDGILQP